MNSHTSPSPNLNPLYSHIEGAPWNNPLIHPDHNLHRFNYSWNHNHNTELWQGHIFKPIFICNNASTLSVRAAADRWKRHRAETGHSLLKGPPDLLMLTHLKVTSFFYAFNLHIPLYVCICVCAHESVKHTLYACVNIPLLAWGLYHFIVEGLRTWGSYCLCLNIFDKAVCTLVMLERPAQSLAYFFFLFYDWLRRGKRKKEEDKWLRIREKVSECLRDLRCRIQMYGNRWQTMQESKNSFHFSLILHWYY